MHGIRKGLLLSEFISATLLSEEEEVIKLVGPGLTTTCGENVSEQNKKVATGFIFSPSSSDLVGPTYENVSYFHRDMREGKMGAF